MSGIYRQENEYFREIMECSIAYVKYVDNGGCISTFSENMTNEVIDLAMKLKANRDYIAKCLGKEIIKYDKEGNKIEVRSRLSKAKSKANKVQSEQGKRQGYPLVS